MSEPKFDRHYDPKNEFGFDLDFITDPINDAWNAVADVATSIIDRVPGGSDFRDAVKDFANTEVGHIFFTALASGAYGGIGPAAFAMPGLAAGDKSFVHAWLDEFATRIQQTSAILGGDAGKEFGNKVKAAIDKVNEQYRKPVIPGMPISQPTKITKTPKQLAKELGINDWLAAMIISGWNGTPPPRREDFDVNGNEYVKAMGHTIPKQAKIGGAIGKTSSTLAASTVMANQVQHDSQASSETFKKVAFPVGGAVVGAGAALAAGLGAPLIGAAAIVTGGLGWLFGAKKK